MSQLRGHCFFLLHLEPILRLQGTGEWLHLGSFVM
uniref:Uncharacterized protein n=1 Tax=Anguilla anguilla TaxID=7936 RepID=A0A0E9ST08_ANGAN